MIAVGFGSAVIIAWTVVNKIVTSLVELCLESPLAKRIGGMDSEYVCAGRKAGKKKHFIPLFEGGMPEEYLANVRVISV